jgi:DNA-binding NarL/FixJ family response regulator
VTDAPVFIVADDHPLFRDALRRTVESAFPEARIIEAGTLDEVAAAIEAAEEPDLVLFDLNMPGARGFSGLIYLRAQYPAAPVCVVSGAEDVATIRNALALGASGFVPKSASTRAIREAVEAILAGGEWAPAEARGAPENDADARLVRRLKSLTPQQVRVLMMLNEGLLNKQIAFELGVSEATVKAHVSAVLQKLDVENRTQAVLVAGRIAAGQWRSGASDEPGDPPAERTRGPA